MSDKAVSEKLAVTSFMKLPGEIWRVSDKAVSQIHCRRLLDTAGVVLESIMAAR